MQVEKGLRWWPAAVPASGADSASIPVGTECCPALAAPGRVEELGEAARRAAEAASFGDEQRLASALRLERQNRHFCMAWKLQRV